MAIEKRKPSGKTDSLRHSEGHAKPASSTKKKKDVRKTEVPVPREVKEKKVKKTKKESISGNPLPSSDAELWALFDWNSENGSHQFSSNLNNKILSLQYFSHISSSAVQKTISYNEGLLCIQQSLQRLYRERHVNPIDLLTDSSQDKQTAITPFYSCKAACLESAAGMEKYVSHFYSHCWWRNAFLAANGMEDTYEGAEGKRECLPENVRDSLWEIARIMNLCNDPCLFTGKRVLHTFFPLSIRWDAVEDLVQQRWSSFYHEESNTKQLPWIILQEVYRCKVFGVPIAYSSYYEKEKREICSLMHPMLRIAITGHVLGFLDYFVKGYVNGGVYTEDFIMGYESTERELDPEALIDLQAELLLVRKQYEREGRSRDELPSSCACLRDFVEEGSSSDGVDYSFFTSHYASGFRLLGSINKVEIGDPNIIEPTGSVIVESDLQVKSGMAASIAKRLKDGVAEPRLNTLFTSAHQRMVEEIQFNMCRHPRFAPYFELLKIITFCVGLADAFQDAGVFPRSITTDNPKTIDPVTADMSPFPITLPPLPVRHGPNILFEVHFNDMVRTACKDEHAHQLINKMIRNDLADIPLEERTDCLLRVARKTARKAITKAFPQADSLVLKNIDDGSLKTQTIATNFRQNLQNKVCSTIIAPVLQQMKQMCRFFPGTDPVFPLEEIDVTVESYEQFLHAISQACDTFLPQWEELVTREVKARWDEEIRNLCRQEDSPNENIISAIDHVRRVIESKRERSMVEISDTMEMLFKEVDTATALMSDDPLSAFLDLTVSSGSSLVLYSARIKLGYTDLPTTEDTFLGMNGSCGIDSRSVVLERSSAVTQHHKNYCDSSKVVAGGSRINTDTKRFFQMDIPIQHFSGDWSTVQAKYGEDGGPDDVLLLDHCLIAAGKSVAQEDNASYDSFGAHVGHFCACAPLIGRNLLREQQNVTSILSTPAIDGILPIHVAAMSGNYEAVKYLIEEGKVEVDVVTPSGLYPLLIACQLNFSSIAVYLLESNLSEDVNRATDTNVTPLHWAVFYRNPLLVDRLLLHGARLIGRSCDNATPLHLAAQIGCFESLRILVTASSDGHFDCTSDLRIPLHYACLGNHERAAQLLLECLTGEERRMAVLQKDTQSFSPFSLAISLGHVHLALLLCETAGIHTIADAASSVEEEREILDLIADVPVLASYFGVDSIDTMSASTSHVAFQDVTLLDYTKEKIAQRCQEQISKEKLIEDCIRVRELEFLKRVALYGSLTQDDIKTILIAVAKYGLHDWPETLSNCGVDVCIKDLDGRGNDLLYLCANLEEDEVLLKSVWAEYKRFMPPSTHYSHLVRALAASSFKRQVTRNTLLGLFRGVSGPPAVGEADVLLQDPMTSVQKWNFARSVGLRLSRKGAISGASKCRPSVLLRVLSEDVGLQEEVQLSMLLEALTDRRMDNAYIILNTLWPDFVIKEKEKENASLAATVQKMVSRFQLSEFRKDVEQQEVVLKHAVMLQEINASSGKEFFQKLKTRYFLPLKDGTFGVYSWLLARDTEKFCCPWSADIEDDHGMNGYMCSCKFLCTNPTLVEKVASSIGVSVEALLNHPAFTTSLQLYSKSPFNIVEDIINSCPTRPVVAACISSIAQLQGRSPAMWSKLGRQAPALLREIQHILDYVVSSDGVTVLMRLLPLPEAGEIIEYAFASKQIVTALQKRDRYGRSAAHHLVSLAGTKTTGKGSLFQDTLNSIVTKRLRRALKLHPGLLHQQDRYGYTLFTLAAKYNNCLALWYLSTLAPVTVLNRAHTKSGYHALHIAAQSGAAKATKTLIVELGLSPNILTSESGLQGGERTLNLTPLHIAAREENHAVFEVLLELGADPLKRNSRNETPLHWAVQNADEGFFKLIRKIPGYWLLLSKGDLSVSIAINGKLSSFYLSKFFKIVHPNRSSRSWTERTAFLEAVREGSITSIHELATCGADLLSFDADGWNALHYAAQRRRTSILAQILRYVVSLYSSSDLEALLLQCTNEGDTPIHIAAKAGSMGCVEVLLTFPSVRISALEKRNNKGLSPENVAALSGNNEVALTLHEASEHKNAPNFSAVEKDHVIALEKFWAAIPAESSESARHRVERIPLCSFQSYTVQRNLSKESEEMWERSWKTHDRHIAHLLPAPEASIFEKHAAFSSKLVKAFLFYPIQTAKPVVCQLLNWCNSKGVPTHVARFCVEQVVIWEEVSTWTKIIDLFSSCNTLWDSSKREVYPAENHVLWEWLRLFFSPKTINHFLMEEFFDLLQTFLRFLKGSIVNSLPPPEISVGDLEMEFCASVCEKLKAVTAALQETKNEEELKLGVKHLNYLWRRSCRWTLSMITEGTHWMLLENNIFHRFGVRCFNSLSFLENFEEPLTNEARRFVLTVMKEAHSDASDSDLMSWTTAATLAIKSLGLEFTERCCSELRYRVEVDALTEEQVAKYFSFLINVLQSIIEIESEEDVMRCFEQSSFSPVDYMNDVTNALKQRIEKLRIDRLGVDRTVDELIEAFGSAADPDHKFEPHSFTFDGTPIVTLPPEELDLLRKIITVVESVDASTYSSNYLKEQAIHSAAETVKKPTARHIGELIAYVREGVYRIKQKRPFRIQCMCLAAFLIPICNPKKSSKSALKGRLAQVATGEGKSIIVAMTSATFALLGQTVDVITSSRPLAIRDALEFSPFFQFWGLRVSHIAVQNPTTSHFNAEILYGTNTDFEFTELREGCYLRSIRMFDPYKTNSWVPRPKEVSIVDEADNLFLDAAQNSARIAYSTGSSFTWVYAPIFNFVVRHPKDQGAIPASSIRQHLKEMQGGYYAEMAELLTDAQLEGWVQAVYLALQRKRDTHYIVRQKKVLIIDLDTGRIQESSRWSRGIHEMVEVKEGVPVQVESGTIGSVAHPSFFDGYKTVLGITGTAGEPEEREEIMRMYGVDSFDVPPHRPCLRERLPSLIFATTAEKNKRIVESALEKRRMTSVLVLVPTIKESNDISALIKNASGGKVCCLVLNETQRENEDFILLKASHMGTILVATNTAGRGTDIRLSKEVIENGGLHVIYGAFPPNLRVECQGLGRSARQGQPGSNQIFISLDEELVKNLLGPSYTFESTSMEECVKLLYAARTQQIRIESKQRSRATALERVHFACLQHFFSDQRWFHEVLFSLSNSAAVKVLRNLLATTHSKMQASIEEVLQRLRECFRILWVLFFTQLSDQRDPSLAIEPCEGDMEALKRQGEDLYKLFIRKSRWVTRNDCKENLADSLKAIIDLHQKMLFGMKTETKDKEGNEKSPASLAPSPNTSTASPDHIPS